MASLSALAALYVMEAIEAGYSVNVGVFEVPNSQRNLWLKRLSEQTGQPVDEWLANGGQKKVRTVMGRFDFTTWTRGSDEDVTTADVPRLKPDPAHIF